jgi:hypothetical protein
MRTTVTLDDDVFEIVQTLAKSSGRRFGEVLSELVRRGLARSAPRRARSSRFPTFDVPAGAPMIPNGRIQKLLDREGVIGPFLRRGHSPARLIGCSATSR